MSDDSLLDADDRRQRTLVAIDWGTFGVGLAAREGWRWLTVHELHTREWSYLAVGVGPFLFIACERVRHFC